MNRGLKWTYIPPLTLTDRCHLFSSHSPLLFHRLCRAQRACCRLHVVRVSNCVGNRILLLPPSPLPSPSCSLPHYPHPLPRPSMAVCAAGLLRDTADWFSGSESSLIYVPRLSNELWTCVWSINQLLMPVSEN